MIADTRRCVYVPGYRIAHSTTRTAVLYIMYDTHHVQMYSSRYIIATVRIKDLENYFFHFFTFRARTVNSEVKTPDPGTSK